MARLEKDDTLPTLTASAVEGGQMTLPDDFEGAWSVLVFYRGHW